MDGLVGAASDAGAKDGYFLAAIASLPRSEPAPPLGFGGATGVVLFEKLRGVLRRVRSAGGAHFVRLDARHYFP